MRKILGTAAASLLILSAAACSSGPQGDGRECIEVPMSIMDRIAEGANTTPITPIAGGAVRSESFADATIVALSFEVEGDTETGVWAIGGTLDDPGTTLAIDAMAATVTEWPNEMNGQKFDITEDGATEALDCLDV